MPFGLHPFRKASNQITEEVTSAVHDHEREQNSTAASASEPGKAETEKKS